MTLNKTKSNRAFTIVEMLMALMILGMLLASVALAFQASASSYKYNEDMLKAMNTARQALWRITTDARVVNGVALIGIESDDDIDNKKCSMKWWVVEDDDSITLIKHITYHYNTSTAASYNPALDENTLYQIVTVGDQPGTYVLCRNVSDMSFDRSTVPGDPAAIRSVRIKMTVTIGQTSQTVATAAILRKNLQ